MKEIWQQDAKTIQVIRPGKLQEGTNYRPSLFSFPFTIQARSCLFHTLTRVCLDLEGAFFENRIYTAAEIASSQVLSALVEKRFLVPEDHNDAAYYKSVIQVLRLVSQKKRFSTYTILPTTGCNARCVYCYEEGMPKETMTSGTVNQMIRFIRETHDPERPVHLAWFGGEPLLCADVIDRVSQALSDAGIDYRSSMISNGSLINASVIDKITGLWRMQSVQLSMDCDEAEYIRRKHYYQYNDEYHRVMRSAGELAARGIRVTVRCNVDEQNLIGIEAFLKDLDTAIPGKAGVSVYFQPLYDTQSRSTSGAVWAACEHAMFRLKELGFQSIGGTRIHRLKLVHCMSESPYECVVIAPDGKLYNCEHCPPGTSFGNVKDGITDPGMLSSFALPEEVRTACRNCCFLPECTSFTRCPVKRAICREVEERWLRKALELEVEKAIRNAAETDAEDPVLDRC